MIGHRVEHARGNLRAGGVVEEDERSRVLERRELPPDLVGGEMPPGRGLHGWFVHVCGSGAYTAPWIAFMADNTTAAATYGDYLKIDELLSLQQPRSDGPEHDEMLFIIIHQVYELWFKELLHEFDRVMRLLEGDESHRAQHTLKRILTILKVMVAQLDILETMTPLEFLSFRARLEAASGFQSDQFRQIEFLLGVKSEQAIERFAGRHAARARRWSADTERRRCGTRSCAISRARSTRARDRISREP